MDEIQLQNMKANGTDTENVQKHRFKKVEKKANHTLLILMGGLTVASIILVSCSTIPKITKPCAIKEAIESLKIDFTVSCKYEDIEENIKSMFIISWISFVFNCIWLLLVLCLSFVQTERRRTCFIAVYIIFALVSLGISIPLLICSKKMADSKSSQQHLDYGTLKKVMLDSLTHSFTSDVITSSGTVSDRWNKFFIKYDCCAVNQVISTTNDFDTTPWCTTSGSCQQTNSQIPKTCCKDVTEHDYVNATDSCHATVNTGSYKDSCFSRVKKLSDNTSIQEYQIDAIINLSFILALMAIVAILQVIVMTVHCFLSLHEK
ncbi:uncharacterized protein LOC133177189 isoform X2 [Saccostrea echinata]|nr:uncharacterized protein LOC133177189 isoform X2 [Saccostrea echinata]